MRPPPRDVSWLTRFGLVLAAALLVGWLSQAHGLRFVDLISFSRRARELSGGKPPSDGLYPLGYPALLAIGHALGGSVFGVAKGVSVLAAVGLVAATHRRLGLAAGLWLLAQGPLLQWGGTEGTDLLAAALGLSSLFLAERPLLAGLCLGAALDVRWTSAVWVPALVLAAERRGRLPAILAVLVGTFPHWLACMWSGALVLPDQSLNLAIAAGPGAPPSAAGIGAALERIPEGLSRAWPYALPGNVARVGAALLAAAAVLPAAEADTEGQRDRRLAAALLLGGSLHVAALAAVFANPRLALPATLAALCGVGVAVHRFGRFGGLVRGLAGLAAVAVGGANLWVAWPTLRAPAPEEKRVRELSEALAGAPSPLPAGAVLSNSPLAHTEEEGWLIPSIHLGGLYVTPRTTPAELGRIADQAGRSTLVLDPTRGRRDYAGLAELFEADSQDVSGWTLVSGASWRVWVRDHPQPPGPG